MASPRRLVVFNRVSLDGCFSASDGGIDWVVPDAEIDRAAAGATPSFDTFLFGRRTYELLAAFWPKVDTDAPIAPDPHRAGQRFGFSGNCQSPTASGVS